LSVYFLLVVIFVIPNMQAVVLCLKRFVLACI
jgi:hypothetical protein